MTIEQHAEAAADFIDGASAYDEIVPAEIIAKHIQSAIDEATAKQMAWIGVLTSEIARLESEIVRANTERVRMQEASEKMNNEVCQTLGKALRYPWFKDDQENFPGATEADGVGVGDHVAESLAAEAAKRIAELEQHYLDRCRDHAACNARIAQLEGLGPLIERLERDVVDAAISNRDIDTDPACAVTRTEVETILKGGA